MALNKKTRKVPNGARVVQETLELTIDQALIMAVAAKKAEGLRDRTLKDYEKHYGYFIKWLREKHPEIEYVNDITVALIRDHISYMRYDQRRYEGHTNINSENQRVGLTDTTVNIRLRTLKAIFNQLVKDELLDVSPFDKVKLLRQDIDLTNRLTDDEVKAILAQPNQRDFVGFRDYVGMVLMLDSGLRISELLELRVLFIDFQTRFISIPADKSKNRKERMVPISAYSAKLLLQLVEENRQFFTTDRIFMSSFCEPLAANNYTKRLKYYGEKAGVSGKKMTAHVYRHTWAHAMTTDGADPFTLQKMGGWADIRTMRRYIQMDTRDIRKSHDEHSPVGRFIKKRK
ncbi:tyrosine-type recombinase/integrase [Paenibacillus sp. FSL H8-0259]|uniref:tyrosine-type recombinase/integrase n=1 Tax=Paenibacillus sp. FSL H8-0259 TaxID=1920423 RepID=UPI00096BE6C4|nr:tyrosine-type recombinase/integrase [Paenibacillus sp. FSL H8-0259]OMF21860.1 integrase [Paenibacillus sp. FSL H8-0259]